MTTAGSEVTDEKPAPRGIDGLMFRYSRWKRRSLEEIAEAPLSALALRTLYLCGCILIDGVILPWILTIPDGGFSLVWFAVLLVPALAGEVVGYHKLKAAAGGTA